MLLGLLLGAKIINAQKNSYLFSFQSSDCGSENHEPLQLKKPNSFIIKTEFKILILTISSF